GLLPKTHRNHAGESQRRPANRKKAPVTTEVTGISPGRGRRGRRTQRALR
ncbi:hypothetical protein SLA2020_447190, partial [Shorea laevis]